MFLLSLTATCQVCALSLKAGLDTYNRPAADACQPSLLRRCGCQARLRPSVDMTADVKSWLKIFYVFMRFFT
jgi:hypothetical protein